MIDTPEVTNSTEQTAAVVRLTIPRTEMQDEFGPAIDELVAALNAQGIEPAGPVFAHHLVMDPEKFDFELGVPVEEKVNATGRVKPGKLPAKKVARTVYHGPYEGLPDAWGEFDAWLRDKGLSQGDDLWERYVTGPHTSGDPSTWQTELNRPIVD